MKLRIKGDSLRLRLTQAEVARLGAEGSVEDRVRFGGADALVYRLRRVPQTMELAATFADGTVEVRVADATAKRWCSTGEVSLEGIQARDGVELRILVEKDFACLAPRQGEDESDQFPHPRAGI